MPKKLANRSACDTACLSEHAESKLDMFLPHMHHIEGETPHVGQAALTDCVLVVTRQKGAHRPPRLSYKPLHASLV